MELSKSILPYLGVALCVAGCGGTSSDTDKSAATAQADAQPLVVQDQPQARATNAVILNAFQSFQVSTPGFTNRYLRHRDNLGRTDVVDGNSAAQDKADASFRVVSGLADANCYSIEAQNFPGHYLRHQQSRVHLDKRDNTSLFDADATWCGKPGLSGNGISLESFNFRGRYMRHFNAEVWLAAKGGANPGDTASNFEADSSWNVAEPWSPNGLAISTGAHTLRVTTANLTNRYARHSNGLGYTDVVDNNSAALLKADSTFKISAGLSDASCYSLESTNYPGRYLRHQNFRIKLAGSDGTATFRKDATFCAQAGLSGTGVSLEASNLPGFFLRHSNGELWIASGGNARPSDSAQSLRDDASWNIGNAWSTSSGPAISSVQLAQSQLFNSNDSALLLVSNKALLVKVNATATPGSSSKPDGTLQVQDGAGNVLRTIALTKPSGALPTSVPSVPDLATSYSAVVPAELVKAGLRLQVTFSNGQGLTVNPRVGGGVPMGLVTIPIQIGGAVGQVISGLGSYVQARIPVSGVSTQGHATYVSSRVSQMPSTDDQWDDAFGKLLGEIADLHKLEGANDQAHYMGFIPKSSWGLLGLGYVPGTATVVADFPAAADAVRRSATHELGHNYKLSHAACGGAGTPDPAYPYPNAQLGSGDHYTWGYLFDTSSFFDPRGADTHDMMSYCGGSTFSDYNTRLMQAFLTPTDAVKAAAVNRSTENLLLISGQITGDKATLSPLKSFVGKAEIPATGEYTLHIVTAKGELDYPFATLPFDHNEGMKSQNFSFSIPHPGSIVSVAVVKGGATLLQSASRPATQAKVLSATSQTAAQVQVREQGGTLQLSWDAGRQPYLTVTVVVGEARYTLAQDLQGGNASLPMSTLPAGGSFEFSLSDGLNTTLVKQERAASQ